MVDSPAGYMLADFDLKFIPHKSIKGNVVSDFLADFPVEESREEYEFLDEDLLMMEDKS